MYAPKIIIESKMLLLAAARAKALENFDHGFEFLPGRRYISALAVSVLPYTVLVQALRRRFHTHAILQHV
jgi:hypothetical protein